MLLVCLLVLPNPVWAEELTLAKERELGERAVQQVLAQVKLVTDPDCVSYVRDLGEKLAKKLDDQRFNFKFYLAEPAEMNAMALPGGYVFMYRGLITKLETEDELAGVMAHEMAHVHYRHIAERMKQASPLSLAALAGMVAGVALGALAGAPEIGQAVAMGAVAGAQSAFLSFSREDELQADYFGYKLMTSLGYKGEDMARTFIRMWQMERTMYASPPAYLLTHPTSPRRMEAIQNMARRHQTLVIPTDNHRFWRVRTRLVALYDDEESATNRFRGELQEKPNNPYALYGLGLVSMRTSNYKTALNSLQKLTSIWKDDSSIKRDMGVCYLRMGEPEKAQGLLNESLAADPGDQETLLALGQSLTQQRRYDEAVFTLRRLVDKNPDLPQAHYDLGVALGHMGRTGEASLHLGLGFLGHKDYKMARYHLDRAVRGLGDKPELQKQATEALEKLSAAEKQRDQKKQKKQPKDSGAG